MFKSASYLARAGIIASLYVVLTLITFPIASTEIQFRASEGLCLLPLIFPEAVLGLFVGCVLSNLITGCVVLDVVFGGLITFASAILTYFVGKLFKSIPLKIVFGGLFPVVLNAFLLPVIWYIAYYRSSYIYIVQVGMLVLSQSLSVYAVGTPIVLMLKNRIKK